MIFSWSHYWCVILGLVLYGSALSQQVDLYEEIPPDDKSPDSLSYPSDAPTLNKASQSLRDSIMTFRASSWRHCLESGAQSNSPYCLKGKKLISPGQQKPGVIKQSVLDFQKSSEKQKIPLNNSSAKSGWVKLINVNAHINSWYILQVQWLDGQQYWFHLELMHPDVQSIKLDEKHNSGIIVSTRGEDKSCDLWSIDDPQPRLSKLKKKPYTSLCDDSIYLRQTIEGYRTTKEWVVEFLRDNIWGGETITEIVKNTLYKDRYLLDSKVSQDKSKDAQGLKNVNLGPLKAQLDPAFEGTSLSVKELGIAIKSPTKDTVSLGQWYPSKYQRHIYVSAIKPQAISSNVKSSFKKYVKQMGQVEANAIAYLVAFDLSFFDLKFSLGTEHPRLAWSERARPQQRDPNLPGPDGFANHKPFATTGLIPPHLSKKVIATFTGGFKRSHGAFKWGNLSKVNSGSHYGFIENGVVFSKMQESLASLIIYKNGRVDMKTWSKQDEQNLKDIRYARQNGVPLIEFDQEKQIGVPGAYVSNWTLGNWSGSQDREFRTLRAGVCLAHHNDSTFLIYGYFSSMTPTAMARVYQSYGCQYAMHLDMNALEHTYLAIYPGDRSQGGPEQLIKGMKVLDERFKGNVPRFIGYPDNRDYFYLLPRSRP